VTIRIAHLSDIHFGGEDAAAVEAAVAAVAAFAPTLTVVTGDLTLNGLPSEFRAARAWLDRLPWPRLVTPGNHDTPYWNLLLRALVPFNRYRKYIGEPQVVAHDAPGLAVRCINSARGAQPRPDWSKGAMALQPLRTLDWGADATLKVFGCHHPWRGGRGHPRRRRRRSDPDRPRACAVRPGAARRRLALLRPRRRHPLGPHPRRPG